MIDIRWPTPEEIEAQQDPFDVNGTFPYQYSIVIVEQIGENLFEEQLRTYDIEQPLDEANLAIPEKFSVRAGRRFRFAEAGEKPDMQVMNQETANPIGLVSIKPGELV